MAKKPKDRPPGRPSSYNAAVHQAIVASFAEGNSLRTAATTNGISASTLSTWLRLGELAHTQLAAMGHDADAIADDDPLVDERYRDYRALWRDVERARDSILVDSVSTVSRAAGGQIERSMTKTVRDSEGHVVNVTTIVETQRDVRAAQWILERLDRERFGLVLPAPEELTALQTQVMLRVLNRIAEEYPELVSTDEGREKFRRILDDVQAADFEMHELGE